MEDSPGNTITLYDYQPAGTSGPLHSIKQDTVFQTWLFAQNKVSGQRVFLRWFTWRMEADILFNNLSNLTDDNVRILRTTKTAEGNGVGPARPVDIKRIVTYPVIPFTP